ncbi:MAG: DUF6056 family protein [Lachnospiraceae bacterium]|nr:DUF6056 family protein [Lachnospiraceae bacterium]
MEKKKIPVTFVAAVAAAYVAILVFMLLTPMLTDDFSYSVIVRKASSLGDLIAQERDQYMNWTGRSMAHFLLRLFLKAPHPVFCILSAGAFTGLSVFIYMNAFRRESYDTRAFLLIQLLMWLTGVSFPQTVLWETGACTYLWGSFVIMAFVTAYRAGLNAPHRKWLFTVLITVLGFVAGWFNENTSAGGIFICAAFLILYVKDQGRGTKALRPWMISSLVSSCLSFLIMISAPGNKIRASFSEENHSGLYGMAARVQKLTLKVNDNFFVLLSLTVLLFAVLKAQGILMKSLRAEFVFLIAGFLTVYSLSAVASTEDRALFGAGMFLIVVVASLYSRIDEKDVLIKALKNASVCIALMYFFFLYLDSGADLARIYRESSARLSSIEEQMAGGERDVTAEFLHTEFDNPYTAAYESEITDDPEYWVNVAYAEYFGADSVTGVPRADSED